MAAAVARARWLMIISAVTTAIAIAAVAGIIGYRMFDIGRGAINAPGEGTVTIPKGARVISAGVAGARVVVTYELNGERELRIYDVRTLKQIGRFRIVNEP